MKKTDKLNFRNIFTNWTPVIIWAWIIFLFSSYPTGEVSEIQWRDFVFKKTAHLVEYGILTILIYRALVNSNFRRKKAALFSVSAAVLYGLSDEFHQSFTPGRMPKLYDVIFDTIGSISSICLLWKLLPKAQKRLKIWVEKLQIGL